MESGLKVFLEPQSFALPLAISLPKVVNLKYRGVAISERVLFWATRFGARRTTCSEQLNSTNKSGASASTQRTLKPVVQVPQK
ncbi:MAG: hypothetical protein EAZ60_08725 [Oscillatoriales cyanobacterium]|nr:MAG: hypothetical protein EAZ79_22765 [Oscillatoriales cyanobacterium]TAF30421.1 MAG: hypothetical protein EAZ69_22370 [Oscillatoriales cyanobacterium]TAF56806.1 MAG: hypothetical protein EAZ60_08725 [Oscillatoriales cyanobacterium]